MNERKHIVSILKSELGWKWGIFFLKCLKKSKKLFKHTSWGKQSTLESKFAKRLSISAALYLELQKKFNTQKAFEIVRSIILPLGLNEMIGLKNKSADKDPMERLLAFFAFIRAEGVGKFVKRTLIAADSTSLKYEVRECLFVRFYKEVGAFELARLFCEVDRQFFPNYFPEFHFHRGSSFENTEAYGKDHCKFIFEGKSDLLNYDK